MIFGDLTPTTIINASCCRSLVVSLVLRIQFNDFIRSSCNIIKFWNLLLSVLCVVYTEWLNTHIHVPYHTQTTFECDKCLRLNDEAIQMALCIIAHSTRLLSSYAFAHLENLKCLDLFEFIYITFKVATASRTLHIYYIYYMRITVSAILKYLINTITVFLCNLFDDTKRSLPDFWALNSFRLWNTVPLIVLVFHSNFISLKVCCVCVCVLDVQDCSDGFILFSANNDN